MDLPSYARCELSLPTYEKVAQPYEFEMRNLYGAPITLPDEDNNENSRVQSTNFVMNEEFLPGDTPLSYIELTSNRKSITRSQYSYPGYLPYLQAISSQNDEVSRDDLTTWACN